MLEIVFLIWFGRKVASEARAKGRSGAWAMLAVGMWIGGEVFGLLLGAMLGLDLGMYLLALLCAGVGAFVSYGIVSSLSPTELALDAAELGAEDESPTENPPRDRYDDQLDRELEALR